MNARHAVPGLALLVLAASLASADAAPGDTASIEIEFVETLPPGRPQSVELTLTLCAASSGLVGGARHVRLEAEAPDWLDVAFEPDAFTFAVPFPGDCDSATGLVRLNATTDAPGFEIATVPVRAVDATDAWIYGRVDYGFRVGYAGKMRVAPTESRVDAPVDEPVPLALAVTNHGNAETTFLMHAAGAREDAHAVLPEPLRLAPGETGSWRMSVLAPSGTGMEARSIDLLVTSHATLDHTALGESAVVRVTLVPEAGTARLGMPGLEWGAAVAALVLAWAARGRR